jgi:hypothetical protein
MRVRRLASIVIVLLAILLGTFGTDLSPVAALYQGGPEEGQRWPGTQAQTTVTVCFRPFGTVDYDSGGKKYTVNYPYSEWLAKQALVRDALEDSWAKWTNLSFVGWGTCPADVSSYIYVDLIKEDCGGCGDSIPRGYHPEGVRIWLMMENPDERLIRSVTIHEFGHALGFHHEMDRPDATFPPGTQPCDRVEYTQGTYLTPYYDDVSIMNYCAPRNRNGLSAGDREGAQNLYGTSTEGTWLKTLPGQPLFIDVSYTNTLPFVVK